MGKEILKNVITTLAYYDSLDYPLTTFEVWQQLLDTAKIKKTVDLKLVAAELAYLRGKKWIEEKRGMWYFTGRDALVWQRIQRQKISIRKIRKMKRWAKLLRVVPYLRGIFITGTLAMKKSNNTSDWDVLVVLKAKRIWIGRLLISGVLHLCGKRRHEQKIQDRFCLNHYITEEGMILEEQNEYTANEIAFGIPLYGVPVFKKYQQLNYSWVRNYKNNFWGRKAADICSVAKSVGLQRIQFSLEALLERTGLGDGINGYCEKIMIKKILRNPLTTIEGSDIRYNDQSMVFLPYPQRDRVMQRTYDHLTKLAG